MQDRDTSAHVSAISVSIFEAEQFRKFLRIAFVFAISRLNKFSKYLSDVINSCCSSYFLVNCCKSDLLEAKIKFICFDDVSITGGCLEALSNTNNLRKVHIFGLAVCF